VTNTVLLTANGRDILLDRFRNLGATTYANEPKIIGWGTGGIAGGPFTAATTDVAMFQEAPEARVTGTSSIVTTTTTNDTYQVTGTVTCTQGGGETIAEMLLADATSKPAANTVAAGGVVGSAVSTTLNTGTNFTPGTNGYCQIRTEVMQVTAGSGTSVLTVVRGANGSTAISTIAASDIVTAGNAPGSTVVTNGDTFVHASFSGIALSNSDSIAFTATVQLT
jgi:hypothetical protein